MVLIQHLKTGHYFELKKEYKNIYSVYLLNENMRRIPNGVNVKRETAHETRLLKKENCKVLKG